MRRPRRAYAAVLTAIVGALVALVAVVWSRSEVAHTSLHTVATPPPSVAQRTPAAALRAVWQTGDRVASGAPTWGGTVITSTTDSVRGRDATNGALTWSYTRTDRVVCQVVQDQGVTLAFFFHAGNCDEVTGLDSSTGARRWTRTLDKDGQPLNGTPGFAVAPFTVMISSPGVIYALDPSSGLDRWTFAQPGCTIRGAVLGSAGALISQSCVKPKCDGLKFCGPGPQLLLRDATAGRSDADKDKANPDQIKWDLIGNSDVPAAADQIICAVDVTDRRLDVLDLAKGTSVGHLPLRNADPSGLTQLAGTREELLWIAGTTYAVGLTGDRVLWSADTEAPPSVAPGSADIPAAVPDLSQAIIAVPGPHGIETLAADTGMVRHTYPVPPPAPRTLVHPFGSGFIVAGSPAIVYQ